jgi:serine/threonine protein kinase
MTDIVVDLKKLFPIGFEFQYDKQKIPSRILYHNTMFRLDKTRKAKTKFGFVRFYGKRFAVKFIKRKFIHNAIDEIIENVKLSRELNKKQSLCNQYIMELLFVDNNSKYIMLVFNALSEDLISYINSKLIHTYETAIRLVHDISFAILCLLQMNFVYGDLKPDNILIDDNRFVLTDFDTLKITDKNGYASDESFTHGFRSLDRMKNHIVSIKDDVWSLSIVLYIFIVRKHSSFQNLEDFTKITQRNMVKDIKDCAKQMNWTPLQIRHIVKIFLSMNEYDSTRRIHVEELLDATTLK